MDYLKEEIWGHDYLGYLLEFFRCKLNWNIHIFADNANLIILIQEPNANSVIKNNLITITSHGADY